MSYKLRETVWTLSVPNTAFEWWRQQAKGQDLSTSELMMRIAEQNVDIATLLAPTKIPTGMAASEAEDDRAHGEVREALREGAVAALRMYQEEVQVQCLGELAASHAGTDLLDLIWELRGVAGALGVITEAGK